MTPEKQNYTLQQLLALEDDEALLQFSCPGSTLPAWPLIRTHFIRTLMSDLLYKSGGLNAAPGKHSLLQMASYLARSQYHNWIHRHAFSADICFFTTGLGNFSKDQKTHERLAGYFASSYPEQSMLYQAQGDWTWWQNHHFNTILHATPFNTYLNMMGRLRVTAADRKLASRIIEHASRNTASRLGYQLALGQKDTLKTALSRQLAAFPISANYHANWFARHNTRLLFLEAACYGARSVSILHAARMAGVTTAEHQHGAISKGHDGYNVAPTLAASPSFRQTLPDYLLTYGNWWSRQSNMPIPKLAIGNPHLAESLKRFTLASGRNNRVLVLGDGIETQLYLDLAARVHTIVGKHGYNIVFRPHPLEKERLKTVPIPAGVELDSNGDIYASLQQATVVISELSTGLFEAVGLVDKVILWETDKSRFAYPELPFPAFSTMQELEMLLLCGDAFSESAPSAIQAHELWQPDWEENYRNFVEKIIGINNKAGEMNGSHH